MRNEFPLIKTYLTKCDTLSGLVFVLFLHQNLYTHVFPFYSQALCQREDMEERITTLERRFGLFLHVDELSMPSPKMCPAHCFFCLPVCSGVQVLECPEGGDVSPRHKR